MGRKYKIHDQQETYFITCTVVHWIELGIPVEQLQGGEVLRIDFKPTNKIEVPTGNEFGANNQWIPGGKLPEGNLEAVIKTEGMVINTDYTTNIIQ